MGRSRDLSWEVSLFMHKVLERVRMQSAYPITLDMPEVKESRSHMSPYDLLRNLITLKRARRGVKLSRLGFPWSRDDPVELYVGDLTSFASSLKLLIT